MKIEMTKSLHGTLDGVTVRPLTAGSTYSTPSTAMGERMGLALIRRQVAKLAPDAGAELRAPVGLSKPVKPKRKPK
jgi:hypothetical protein